MKKLICIYTCKQDIESLNLLKQTDWYKEIIIDKNNTVFSVYADPTINEEYVVSKEANTLTVKAKEEYSKLSLKTYQMIKACVDFKEFDYLIKVDVDHFEEFIKYYTNKDLYEEYDGIRCEKGVTINSIIRWTKEKGIDADPYKIFKSDKEVPTYYSGRCYVVGYEFCEYISKNGKFTAELLAEQLAGIEDIMIGILYEKYKKETRRSLY